jgi:iron complex transport system permease protein
MAATSPAMTNWIGLAKCGYRNGVKNVRIDLTLAALILALAILSLMVGPAGLSPRAAIAGLFSGEGPAGVIVRDIRLPRTLLAALIGATLGLSGAALQGLLRNPLAEPALFGAPQAAAAAAALVIAFGFAPATSFSVPVAGILGATISIAGLVAIAGRRASLTVTLLAGLALASFAGAMTALILNLAPNPFVALEIAFWLLGSLEDRSSAHLMISTPFMLASWVVLGVQARAFRALTLGEDAAASLGIDVARTRIMVVIGVALGVGAAVAVAGAVGFVGLVAPHLVRRAVGSDPARVMLPAALAGATLVLAADIAIRLGPSVVEIKLGVVTALIGVPIFLSKEPHHERARRPQCLRPDRRKEDRARRSALAHPGRAGRAGRSERRGQDHVDAGARRTYPRAGNDYA